MSECPSESRLERKAGATGHPMYFIVRSGLGTALLELKRPKEAEPHLLGALKGLKKNRLAPPSGIQAMLDLIVRVYEQRHAAEPGQGFDSKAEEWRAKADKHRASTQPADPRDRAPAATQP